MVKTPPPDLKPLQEVKSIVVRSVTAVVVIIGVAITLFVIMAALTIYGLTSGCKINEEKQEESVTAQKAGLNRLIILDGQRVSSEGHKSAECPDGSTSASAELPTSLNASQAAAEVKQNLEKQGFKQENPLDIPPRNGTPKKNDVLDSLEETYFKNDNSEELNVSYNFTKKYLCGEAQQPCNQQVSFFLQTPLKSVDVYYTLHP